MRAWALLSPLRVFLVMCFWVPVATILSAALVSFVIPGLATPTGSSSFHLTPLGGRVFAALWFGLVFGPLIVRAIIRLQLERRGEMPHQQPLISETGALNPDRYYWYFWRSGTGTVLLILGWAVLVLPFAVWFYVFIQRNERWVALSLRAPWFWVGLILALGPPLYWAVRRRRLRPLITEMEKEILAVSKPRRGMTPLERRVFRV